MTFDCEKGNHRLPVLTFGGEQKEAESDEDQVDAADHVHPVAERLVGVEDQGPGGTVQVLQLVELPGEGALPVAAGADCRETSNGRSSVVQTLAPSWRGLTSF